MKSVGIALFGLLVFTFNAWSGTPALVGTVTDTSGRPVKGAEVKIEAKTGKFSNVIKTDANGRYAFNGLAPGSDYKVTLVINGTIKAQILNAALSKAKPTELNFDLRHTKPYTGKRRMVYVSEQTGTHIGGGRWITVDENGNPVSDDATVSTIGTSDVHRMQMNGSGASHPKSGGGGN